MNVIWDMIILWIFEWLSCFIDVRMIFPKNIMVILKFLSHKYT
jgi:hypothetical protein